MRGDLSSAAKHLQQLSKIIPVNIIFSGPSSDTQSTLSRSSSTASEWTRDIKDNQTEKKTTAEDVKQEDEQGYTNLQVLIF